MKKFKYRALKKDGVKFDGVFEGNSKEELLKMLKSKDYYPLKIEEVIESKNIEFMLFEKKVKAKDLAVFCRQFYTMLDAGLTILNCLNILSKEIQNKTLRDVLANLEEDVKKGEILSESMGKHKDIFPKLLISMVESGEASGNIDEMMLRMSIHFEKENKINNKVKGAMSYPMILAFVAIAAVTFIMLFVMPTFLEMFESEGITLPLITKILLGLSSFLSNNIIFIVFLIIAMSVVFNIYRKTDNGIESISKIKLKTPALGTLNKKIIVSRFTRTLSTLLSAGVSLVHALPIVAGVLGNKVAEDAILKVREKVVKGEGLSGPIRENELFPKMLSSMIRIGEESGSLDEILNKTADFYDDEVEQAIQTATSLIEPIMIVIMGVVIGGIVLSIMIPMFNMYSEM
jgi:type IV pilus assembly protein PilC